MAGANASGYQRIRPTTGQRLTTDLLKKNGGHFSIGDVVDLGPVTYAGRAPEMEDYRFSPQNIRSASTLTPEQFEECLRATSSESVKEAFGEKLEENGRGFAIPKDCGSVSLASVQVSRGARLHQDSWGKVKLNFSDGYLDLTLSVTDIRLYEDDQKTPDLSAILTVNRELARGGGWVMLGLSRAWQRPGDTEARHWLQVNNIHLAKDLLGRWAC